DPARFRDLERIALQFAADLRRLAAHASTIGEDAFGDLRTILDEALTRIRTEVFQPDQPQAEEGSAAAPDPGAPPQADTAEPPRAKTAEPPRAKTAEPPQAKTAEPPR